MRLPSPEEELKAWKYLVGAALYWIVFLLFPLPDPLIAWAFVGGVVVLGLVVRQIMIGR